MNTNGAQINGITSIGSIFTISATTLYSFLYTLSIIPNSDYVTLMTCTPYGINTHRLLIRSHRIETVYKKEYRVVGDN